MKLLPILWQRLVDAQGKTCDRCDATHQEIQRAVEKLGKALRPLGIEPSLVIKEIDDSTFANPLESNRIWIAGRPMEDWLDRPRWPKPVLLRLPPPSAGPCRSKAPPSKPSPKSFS